MRHRGFSITELILAFAVGIGALLVFLSVFSSSGRHALQTRNRAVAILLAESLMDEIEAHPYGEPEPRYWTEQVDQPVTVRVDGLPQEMIFHKTLSYDNGSFVGQAAGTNDVVTVTITWKEGVGDDQTTTPDNKELVVQVPVWR